MSNQFTREQLEIAAARVKLGDTSRLTHSELFDAVVAEARRLIDSVSNLKKEPEKKPKEERKEKNYFKVSSGLTEPHERYCRCIAHVAAQQPDWCLKERAWFQTRAGKKCYNPYPICTKSTKRQGFPECSANFDFTAFPDNELIAYANLFYDQVVKANGWKTLPDFSSDPDWRVKLEQGLQKWITLKKAVQVIA